jgi:hypothetical protein
VGEDADAGPRGDRAGPTGSPAYGDLSTDGLPTECPEFDDATSGVTPVPYPDPSVPDDHRSAVELATRIEAAYLDNRVVTERDPVATTGDGTPVTPTPDEPTYPEMSLQFDARSVVQETDDGAVVDLRYERVVDGDSEGRYAVVYYITDSAVARAEQAGYDSPGPHPTGDGVRLSCWDE